MNCPDNHQAEYEHIPPEEFEFVQADAKLHDKELQTKPIGYFQDAMIRFAKNKGSVVCACIILVLVIYAIVVPAVSRYAGSLKDGMYAYALPKLSTEFDLGFWNGTTKMDVNQATYDYYSAIPGAIVEVLDTYEKESAAGRTQQMYTLRIDTYRKMGYVTKLLTQTEYDAVLAYQEESGVSLLQPVINTNEVVCATYKNDSNAWYLTNQKGVAIRDDNGELQNIFKTDETSEDGYAYYTLKNNGTQYEVRVYYYDWYIYENGFEPCFIFGADEYGYDIFSRLATGARLSLTLSVTAAVINLIIGIIVGALEGYYGGAFDLIFERVKDILWQVPSVIFMTLFQIYFSRKLGSLFSMFICFIAFGWISTSSTVRAQFYRFKGQEYVMAARTLGAKDRQLIFRHILPNAAGFIITASVLTIPGIIFSEATYSYLGIVNLNSATLTSVGTMLENGQSTLTNYPHCVFFPALFLSLLLICFNMFGNGLRDAFNPSLRGADS